MKILIKLRLSTVTALLAAAIPFMYTTARAACNDANGTSVELSVTGAVCVAVGSTNTYGLVFSNQAGMPVDVSNGEYTWSLGEESGFENPENINETTFKLVASTNASSEVGVEEIKCVFSKIGWSSSNDEWVTATDKSCEDSQNVTIAKLEIMGPKFVSWNGEGNYNLGISPSDLSLDGGTYDWSVIGQSALSIVDKANQSSAKFACLSGNPGCSLLGCVFKKEEWAQIDAFFSAIVVKFMGTKFNVIIENTDNIISLRIGSFVTEVFPAEALSMESKVRVELDLGAEGTGNVPENRIVIEDGKINVDTCLFRLKEGYDPLSNYSFNIYIDDVHLLTLNIDLKYDPKTGTYTCIYSEPDGPTKDAEPNPNQSTNEPIDTGTGNNHFTEKRLYVPCPGVPLEFDLCYQSVNPCPEGVLGGGWTHSYEWMLQTSTSNAVLYTGSGTEYLFTLNGNGVYLPCESNNWLLDFDGVDYVVTISGGIEYRFNVNGQLIYIGDKWGLGASLYYDTLNYLRNVIHTNGNRIDFGYETVFTNYDTFDMVERLKTVSVESGPSLTFIYSMDGLFTTVIEQCGLEAYVSTYAYCDGFLTNKVNGAGFEYRFGYESNVDGKLTGRGTYIAVDSGYYEHTVDYAGINETTVAYVSRDGNQNYRYVVDGINRLSYKYGPSTSAEDSSVGVAYKYTGFDVSEEKQFDETVDETFTRFMTYDDFHNVTETAIGYCTSERTPILKVVYDDCGQLPLVVENADGERVETVYTNGSPLRIKAFYSEMESYDTTFGYYTNGLLASTTNANQHVMTYTYDTNGYPLTIAAEIGPIVKNTSSALGFVSQTEILAEDGSSTGRVTEFERDVKGRVKRIDYADETCVTFKYNALDYVTNSVDRMERSIDYVYAPTKRLKSVTRYLEQDGTNIPVRISYDYDAQFNALSITEPRGLYVESYLMDIQDRIVAVTNIENQVMSIEYGVGDFVRKMTRFDGTTITNTYDVAGRKKNVIYLDGCLTNAVVDYCYYADSELKSVADDVSAITNTYDRLNRLTSVTSTMSDLTVATDYQYDPVGNIINASVSVDGQLWSVDNGYTYDAAERLESIDTDVGSFEYTYNPINGQVKSYSNTVSGITTSYVYDLLDRVTNIVYAASNGSLIRSLEYVYDAASMITNKTLIGDGMTSMSSYKYDSLDRLIGETRTGSGSSAFSVSYNYDLAGNRTSMVTRVGSVVSTNIYTLGIGNRLASWGSNGSALYDTAGNTTNFVPSNGASFNLQWDERDRLKQFVVPSSGSSVEYGYDVQGRKISRAVNGSSAISEYYVYDGNQVVADVDASGNLLRTYTYGPGIDNILSMTIHSQTPSSPLQTFYYLKDHQNTVLALTDIFGNVVESYDYQAWGLRSVKDAFGINQTSDRGLPISALGNRYTFQGREIDWDTRLIYFRARWYNPATGRWLSKDPIGIGGGLNQYVFVENDPVNSIDPSGLSAYAAVYDFSYNIGNVDGPYPYADVVGMVILGVAIVYDDGADFISERRGGQGKGERGRTGSADGTNNPGKHRKDHPTDPKKILEKDPHTGKWREKPKPPGWPAIIPPFDKKGGDC